MVFVSLNFRQRKRRADLSPSCPARIKRSSRRQRLKRILFSTLLFSCVRAFGVVPTGQSVTLAWDPNPDTNVVGYNVYYGVASHTYPNRIDAGNGAKVTVSGLIGGVTYYFAVTAYDSLGQESDFSAEISYSVPVKSPSLQVQGMAAGQFVLSMAGQIDHTYEIQATQDFKTWTTIGSVTMAIGGSLSFIDTNAQNFSQRFYRACDAQSLMPLGAPAVQIRKSTTVAGQFILTAIGQIDHTYEIQATQDFKTWTTIGSVTLGASGSLDFTDPSSQDFPERFYRTQDMQP